MLPRRRQHAAAVCIAVAVAACDGGSGTGTAGPAGPAQARFVYSISSPLVHGPWGGPWFVLSHRVDPTTGALVAAGAMRATLRTDDLALHPSGRWLYTAGSPGEIAMYRVDAASGALEQFGVTPGTHGGRTIAIEVHPSGRFAYALFTPMFVAVPTLPPQPDGPPRVYGYSVEPDTGNLLRIGTLATGVTSMVLDPLGRFLFAGKGLERVTYVIDDDTGTLFQTHEQPLGSFSAFAVGRDGRHAYDASADTVRAYRIEENGALDPVGPPIGIGPAGTGQAELPQAFVTEPTGRFAFLGFSDRITALRLDAATGEPQLVGTVPAPAPAGYVAVDPTGRWLFAGGMSGLTGTHVLPGCPAGDEGYHVGSYRIDQGSGLPEWASYVRADRSLQSVDVASGPAATVEPRFVYVANEGSGTVSAFAVDARSGALARLGPDVPAGVGVNALATDLLGRWLLTGNRITGEVRTWRVDTPSGALGAVATVVAGDGVTALAFAATGNRVHAVSRDAGVITTIAFDATSGSLAIGPTEPVTLPVSVATAPAVQNVYVLGADGTASTYWQSLDPPAGTLQLQATLALGTGARAIAVDPTGQNAYVTDGTLGAVHAFRIRSWSFQDPPSPVRRHGDLAPIGSPAPAGAGAAAMAFEPAGRRLLVANFDADDVTTFARDVVSGELSEIGSEIVVGDGPVALAAEPSGRFVYVVNRNSNDVTLLLVDPASGQPTRVGTAASVGIAPAAIAIVGRPR